MYYFFVFLLISFDMRRYLQYIFISVISSAQHKQKPKEVHHVPMKKVTSQDVATRAGVSQSAVSLILNGSEKVLFNDETKERVFAAAKELGYQLPKRKKRNTGDKNGLLLLFTPTLNNPFYAELVQTVERYADACGYRVIVCNTLRKADLEKYYLDTFLKSKIDGIIYTFLPGFPELMETLSVTTPTVLIGEKRADVSICSIELSNERAGAILAEHLYSLGHRRFLFVSTPFNQFTLARQQRLEGMRQFMRAHGLSDDCLQILVPDAHTETDNLPDAIPYEYAIGKHLIDQALDKGLSATALIGVNDMTAIGVMDGLKERGFSVPGDFSVCGFDNIFSSVIANPPLTTIDHHLTVRCKAAVDMVTSRRQEMDKTLQQPPINKVEYSPKLIIRGSTGTCRSSVK